MLPEISRPLEGAPPGRPLKLFCDTGAGHMGAFALRRVIELYSRELCVRFSVYK